MCRIRYGSPRRVVGCVGRTGSPQTAPDVRRVAKEMGPGTQPRVEVRWACLQTKETRKSMRRAWKTAEFVWVRWDRMVLLRFLDL